MRHGLIFGKFLPPHKGHLYLIDAAAAQCDKLTILCCAIPSEPISGPQRFKWLQELRPQHDIKYCDLLLPQYPEDHPDFWHIWRDTLKKFAPDANLLFTSEHYGDKTAEVLGIKHILVDLPRSVIPISARQIRQNPNKHWEYIPEPVRPFFHRRIAIIGPESTGKSTLAVQLAKHYSTAHVEEFGRSFTANKSLDPAFPIDLTLQDICHIALGHAEEEDKALERARELLICDTDSLVTAIWSELYFSQVPEEVWSTCTTRPYDFYLLLENDLPWQDDTTRFHAHRRDWFHSRLLNEITSRNLPFARINGLGEDRFNNAVAALETQRSIWADQLENPADAAHELKSRP